MHRKNNLQLPRVTPFKGVRYNQNIIDNLNKVICPPYDIISEEQQEKLYKNNEYNVIRLEYNLKKSSQDGFDSSYKEAASTLNQWFNDNVLLFDQKPSFYIHDHYFKYLGNVKKRRGIIARIRLDPWYTTVYPHEYTFPEAKKDRLQLMRSCNMNISPIMSLYDDCGNQVTQVLLKQTQQLDPVINIEYGDEKHMVWAIDNEEAIFQISESLENKDIFIADGHHRYETAIDYRKEYEIGTAGLTEHITNINAAKYIMMTLFSMGDTGLLMLPIHRLIRNLRSFDTSKFIEILNEYFTISTIELSSKVIEDLSQGNCYGADIVVFNSDSQNMLLLNRHKYIKVVNEENKHSDVFNELTVNIFNEIILKKVLHLEKESKDIAYIADVSEAHRLINNRDYQIAFILKAPEIMKIKSISHEKERMPYKSTYFYPKLPTGLVMNHFKY